jgi:O-antigen/teichoic acid export membrane protein
LIAYFMSRYKTGFAWFDHRFLRRELIYALPFGMAVLMVTLNMTVDKFTISYLYDSSLYAVYSIGCYQVPIITITFNAVLNIILPRISLMQKNRETEKIIDLWHRATRKLSLIGYPTFVFFMVFAGEFITFLFTPKYSGSIPVFRMFLFLILINVTNYGVILRAYGQTGYIFKSSVFSFLIALACIYPATKFVGLHGAAIVVVVTHGIRAFIQLRKSKMLLGVPFLGLLPWKGLLGIFGVAAFSVMVLFPIKYMHFLNDFLKLSISGILFCAIFGVLAWNIPILTLGEKRKMREGLTKALLVFKRGSSITSEIV